MKVAPSFAQLGNVEFRLQALKDLNGPCSHYLWAVGIRAPFTDGSLTTCKRPHTVDCIEVFDHISDPLIHINPHLDGSRSVVAFRHRLPIYRLLLNNPVGAENISENA
jgi:hypothetical protein